MRLQVKLLDGAPVMARRFASTGFVAFLCPGFREGHRETVGDSQALSDHEHTGRLRAEQRHADRLAQRDRIDSDGGHLRRDASSRTDSHRSIWDRTAGRPLRTIAKDAGKRITERPRRGSDLGLCGSAGVWGRQCGPTSLSGASSRSTLRGRERRYGRLEPISTTNSAHGPSRRTRDDRVPHSIAAGANRRSLRFGELQPLLDGFPTVAGPSLDRAATPMVGTSCRATDHGESTTGPRGSVTGFDHAPDAPSRSRLPPWRHLELPSGEGPPGRRGNG